MKDSKHRNYRFVEPVSKQDVFASELLAEISMFMDKTKLNHDDWILLRRLIQNLKKGKLSNKVLNGIKERFAAVQKQYQR